MARKNRLARETSPYLLLHQDNPVDWYPWGPEALERARVEDKPIFLSVGYATCYWCHVMERESFADAGTAQVMNEHFINIKVDREERPELDEIYMAATQIFNRRGGWPNSVFLTPKLTPFFAGTYFPPFDDQGRPSFRTVLLSMQHAWDERRDDVEEQARELEGAMRDMLEERGKPTPSVPPEAVIETSLKGLADRYDSEWGGFGQAPKFPTPSNLHFLLDQAENGDDAAGDMLEKTLDQMGRGGIYDQLAGGFHRYATDRQWRVPHFEKMLYDNGQLLEIYAQDYARTGDGERERVVRETAHFLARELTGEHGALLSAIDAEVGGREGAFHAWTLQQIVDAVGEEDASFLAPLLGFDGPPFFDGEYVFHLPEPLAAQAERRRLDVDVLAEQVKSLEATLLAAREERPKPLVDDKVLTDWNGLAIAGLATAAAHLSDGGLLEQAERAADFVLENLRSDAGVLQHTWRGGEARFDAFLGDYTALVRGLLALYDAAGEPRYLTAAIELTEEQIERLEDPRDGGFFVAAPSDDVLFRSKEVYDGALPSANGQAALNVLELARLDEDRRELWLGRAERILRAFGHVIESRPDGARTLVLATARYRRARGELSPEQAASATVANLVEKAAQAIVKARLHLNATADEDGARGFRLDLEIRDGWHLAAPSAAADADAMSSVTRVEAVEGELVEVRYPPGQPFAGPAPATVYAESITIPGRLRGVGPLRLYFQPCDASRCLVATSMEVAEAESDVVH
ncbi:MAG: thioredoxin domain-containing protein [Acidobacteriota bacterium]